MENNRKYSSTPLSPPFREGPGEGIELRSEEFQEILGGVPPWILRWGITILAVIVAILLAGSAVFKYPDIISAQIVLTGSRPPATVVAHASGKLKELYVSDKQEVKAGDYLGVIDNPAQTADIRHLKHYLDSLEMEQIIQFSMPDKNLKCIAFRYRLPGYGKRQQPALAITIPALATKNRNPGMGPELCIVGALRRANYFY
jgi:hypothetical protein